MLVKPVSEWYQPGFCLLFSRYGFVEFDDLRDADDAVYELNGKDLCGERVIVEHARGPRRDGSYGSGRSKHLKGICIGDMPLLLNVNFLIN